MGEPPQQHHCYLICAGETCTYNGYTNNLPRRIRQHNREITGGAKATARKQGGWAYFAVVTHPDWDKCQALSFEWHLRHPTGRRGRRPAEFNGVAGRVRAIPLVIQKQAAKIGTRVEDYRVYVRGDLMDLLCKERQGGPEEGDGTPSFQIYPLSDLMEQK